MTDHTDEMVEAAVAARFSEFDGHWTDGLTNGIAQIERMKAEQMLKAALRTDRDGVVEEWPLGMRVTKTKGSKWTGKIVGHYSTDLTPKGVAIESETEVGSVQIYPVKAIRALKGDNHAG